MLKPLIIANWKSNPATVAEAVLLAQKIERGISKLKMSKYRNIETVIAPPYPFLFPVAKVLKKAHLGAQDSFWGDVGPHTGEVSWRQLKNLGVTHAIVGHSERRREVGETDEMVNKKVRTLLENAVATVLCVGEKERDGRDIPPVLGEQLKNALLGVKGGLIKNLILAYEPVWAISTMSGARPDTPDNAFRVGLYLRKLMAGLYNQKIARLLPIIYGGSVRANNIVLFLKEGRMEGALVGGASLNTDEFSRIIRLASLIRH